MAFVAIKMGRRSGSCRTREPREKADPRSGRGDCPGGLIVLDKSIMVTKPQVCLASKRSRHQRSDGDCALSLGISVASRKRSGSAYHQSPWTVAATDCSHLP